MIDEYKKPQERKAFIIAIIFLIAILANLILSLSLGFRSGDWQQFARAGVVVAFGLITIIATIRIRRGRAEAGIWLIIGGFLSTLLGTAALLADFGLILALIEVLIASIVAIQTLPREKVKWAIGIATAAALATYGMDFLRLDYRTPASPAFTTALPVIAWIVIAALVILILRQALRSNIQVKLLIVIFVTLIVAVMLQTSITMRTSREMNEAAEYQRLASLYEDYNDSIDSLTKSSAELSVSHADREYIKQLFLAKDREGLIGLLTPIFETLKNEYDIQQLNIVNPDGTIYVRIHNPSKYGDDVRYRLTIAAALESQETVAGVEIGPGRIGIRGVSPLWEQGEFIGMLEVGLNYDQEFVDNLKARHGADYNLWITYAVAESPGLNPPEDAPTAPTDQVFYYAGTNPQILPISQSVYDQVLATGEPVTQFVSVEDQDWAVVIAPLLGYGDHVIGIVEILTSRTEALAIINQSRLAVLVPASLLTLAGLAAIWFIINLVVLRPMGQMAVVAEKQIAGDLSARVEMLPSDEFGDLGRTFNRLSKQLDTTLKTQEDIITERTKNLEEHSKYLEGSAEVSRAVASITDAEELIKQVVELIKERFDLYYVGLFITDARNEWAVLQAGTGEAGRKMLARGHRLKIGEGMIGWSIANAEARIALDVGEDAVRFENPDLPETHSECALPLRSRGRVLGALTGQSDTEAAFNQDIITTLQTMTDQVAIAIDNARLLAKSEAALEAERRAYGELSQEAWNKLSRGQTIPRYISNAPGIAYPIKEQQQTQTLQAIQNGQIIQKDDLTAIVPIESHGQILGGLRLRKPEDSGAWTQTQVELVETLSEQLSVALESARLYQDTQRRAAREQLTGEIATHLRETLDIETVLATAAQELRDALGIATAEVWIEAEQPSENN
ncbi:MAG: cache domain-containing protein [Chloroflexota bacterium]|nr:cache domain-containing protein [Chloroflexota bacterium]